MRSLEKKSIEAFTKIWDAIASSTPEGLKEALSLLHSDFRGYGSSESEKYTSKEYMEWFFGKQAEEIPGGLSWKAQDLHFKQIDESVAEIFADVSLEMYTPRGTVTIDLMRFSSTLVESEGQMLFTQIHTSVPDRSAIDEEIVPGATEPKIYDEVSILFTDFSGFTTLTSTIPPKKLLAELNDIFASFDRIMLANNLTKIKTIGDSYMAAAGINDHNQHAAKAVAAAKQILHYLDERNSKTAIKWHTRIGIHSGMVIGGTIGSKDLTFDLYGDTVNLASAVEQAGEPGKINISAYTYELIQNEIGCDYRGKIVIKDKRLIDMYFVDQ
jgi:class 3 adenylate cyclase